MAASDKAKAELFPHLIDAGALGFGTFTLKSGRISPYFFTSTSLHKTRLLGAVARAYASVLTTSPFIDDAGNPIYDVLFGPAYKGIPAAANVTRELEFAGSKFDNVGYSFNRKEAKDHGEGGTVVGESLKDKRVVIIDDVMTAGTALREAVSIIEKQGGQTVGVVLLLTRQERVSDAEPRSAMKVAEDDLKVPVRAVLKFEDIMEAVNAGKIAGAGPEQLEQMKAYRDRYGSKD